MKSVRQGDERGMEGIDGFEGSGKVRVGRDRLHGETHSVEQLPDGQTDDVSEVRFRPSSEQILKIIHDLLGYDGFVLIIYESMR